MACGATPCADRETVGASERSRRRARVFFWLRSGWHSLLLRLSQVRHLVLQAPQAWVRPSGGQHQQGERAEDDDQQLDAVPPAHAENAADRARQPAARNEHWFTG